MRLSYIACNDGATASPPRLRRGSRWPLLFAAMSVLLAGCGGAGPLPPENPKERPDKRAPMVPVLTSHETRSAVTQHTHVVVEGVGLAEPAAVVHAEEQDVYLVANINGSPSAQDDNGFVSKLGADGRVLSLRFIDGSRDGVELHAPRGLALVGTTLYVADLHWLRSFNVNTGAPLASLELQGATSLVGVTADQNGNVFVTDVGLKGRAPGTKATGTDAVYGLTPDGKLQPLARGQQLNHPTALTAAEEGLWVSGQDSVYFLGLDGKQSQRQQLSGERLEGISRLADGSLLLSSSATGAILRGTPGGDFVRVIESIRSPASIAYDRQRQRLLVAVLSANRIEAHDVR